MKSIVLTGATGGIGQALARAFAGPGQALFLTGRDGALLTRLGAELEAKGAAVTLCPANLAERDRLIAAITAFHQDHPVDLVILGAGVKHDTKDGAEPAAAISSVIEVNLTQTVALAQALLPLLLERARTARPRLAFIGSLAGIAPTPDLLSYSASKAGLRAYAIAWRRALAGQGVGISIISPGFIDTAMTDTHPGTTPFLMSPEKAAHRILKDLRTGRNEIAFPRALAMLARWDGWLPTCLSDRIHSAMRAK